MIMNTQQLQYLVEIERTRSISHAASNLYMSQPNLSRVLRETENALGFPIFERTRKGVRPTEKGEQFLRHARNILREAEFMERLGPNAALPCRFRLCIPRSYHYMELTRQFLSAFPSEHGLDALIRECHPRRALEMIRDGSAEIAVIRYKTEYEDYFQEQASAHELTLLPLTQTEYQLLMAHSNPLANSSQISKPELDNLTELIHRDPPGSDIAGLPERSGIYTIDRLGQLQMLKGNPSAYLWSEPLPAPILELFGLVQRPCSEGGYRYQDALLYNPQCTLSQLEKAFLEEISKCISKA